MNMRTRMGFTAVAVACAAGLALGYQSGGRGGGERAASTALKVGTGEVGLAYNTLKFGAKTLERMKANEQARANWAEHLPNLLEGTLKTGVELDLGGAKLAAGSHRISFCMTADGGWELWLTHGDGEPQKVPLAVTTGAARYEFLNFNLVSTGADSIRLIFNYGDLTANLDAKVTAAEQ